jgi:hypothetical protein
VFSTESLTPFGKAEIGRQNTTYTSFVPGAPAASLFAIANMDSCPQASGCDQPPMQQHRLALGLHKTFAHYLTYLGEESNETYVRESPKPAPTAAMTTATDLDDSKISIQTRFSEFKRKFEKVYSSPSEDASALSAFTENDEIIQAHNGKGLSYWLGHNEFSDMTW